MRFRVALSSIVIAGCGPRADASVEPSQPAAVDPRAPQPPVGADEPLSATVPLNSGDAIDLASLGGRVVILEFSMTTRPGWSRCHSHYRELLDELGDELVVVAVSADTDPGALQAFWDRDPPPFVLSWDPQGALALRLGVKTMPTTFVLDRRGHIVGTTVGFETATLSDLDELVRRALAQGP